MNPSESSTSQSLHKLVTFPRHQMIFKAESTDNIYSQLILVNTSSTNTYEFKIISSSDSHYIITPQQGRIQPKEQTVISLQLISPEVNKLIGIFTCPRSCLLFLQTILDERLEDLFTVIYFSSQSSPLVETMSILNEETIILSIGLIFSEKFTMSLKENNMQVPQCTCDDQNDDTPLKYQEQQFKGQIKYRKVKETKLKKYHQPTTTVENINYKDKVDHLLNQQRRIIQDIHESNRKMNDFNRLVNQQQILDSCRISKQQDYQRDKHENQGEQQHLKQKETQQDNHQYQISFIFIIFMSIVCFYMGTLLRL